MPKYTDGYMLEPGRTGYEGLAQRPHLAESCEGEHQPFREMEAVIGVGGDYPYFLGDQSLRLTVGRMDAG